MGWVLESLGTERRINVLDLGPASPETIELLHSTSCRLSVANLFDSGIIEQQRQLSPDRLTAHFEEALWMLEGPLHVCLLWDFLNYLSPPALVAFNRALKPWITRNTRAHAFCATKRSAPLMQHRYGVLNAGEIIRARVPEQPVANHPLPWRQVFKALNLFEVVRGTLRTGGIVELIMRGSAARPVQNPRQQGEGRPSPVSAPAARRAVG